MLNKKVIAAVRTEWVFKRYMLNRKSLLSIRESGF